MKFREKIFIIISFITFIQPNFFVKLNFVNFISVLIAVICTCTLIIQSIRKNIKLDNTFFLLVLWRIIIFIPTVVNNGEIIKWGYQSIIFVGLYLLVKTYIRNKESFKLVYIMTIIYLFLNIILMIIYPKGIFPQYGIYFLGIRTRFTEFSIALIYISLYFYNEFTLKKIKDKRNLAFSLLLAFINILLRWVVTGIIVILFIILIYLFINNKKYLKLIYCFSFFILIIVSINVINGNFLYLLSDFFELMNKDITLTGRTIIWKNAVTIAKNNLLFGVGYINDGNIIYYNDGLWQTHNTILQSLCECGIFGTCVFFVMFFKQGLPIYNCKLKINKLNIAVVLGFLLMMITEITYYYSIFYLIIFLIGNCKTTGEMNDNKKERIN